jgi:hypothetical protein
LNFYIANPEIQWSLLAHVVSRNVSYNLTDLKTRYFKRLIDKSALLHIFHTYEKANWIIFSDAFPQLLLYEYNKFNRLNDYSILEENQTSEFIIKEWEIYHRNKENKQLTISQIINEQNLIHKTVIKDKLINKNVFQSLAFNLQD